MIQINKIYNEDCLSLMSRMDDDSINCCVSSPPYFNLRSYLPDNHGFKNKEIGCHDTPEEFVDKLCNIYDEVHRVLKDSGSCFVVLGDSYLGSGKGVWGGRSKAKKESFQFQSKPKENLTGWRKPKQLSMVPARFAIEMQNRGWLLRNTIIWYKKNALPQSTKDRWVTNFEYIFFFTKGPKYYFNQQIEPFANSSNPNEIYTGQATKNYQSQKAQNPSDSKRRILESMRKRGGRSQRAVWEINTKPSKSKTHTASFPEELVERIIKAGCPPDGLIFDPFNGTGTSCHVAKKLGRNYIGCDISDEFCKVAEERLLQLNTISN